MTDSDGRLLECVVCGQLVRVHEIPDGWIDPGRFVCGDKRRHLELGQLSLETQLPRDESPAYDPDQSGIGY